jgi:hypothetical protein
LKQIKFLLRDQIGKAILEQITDLRKMGIFYKKERAKTPKIDNGRKI